MPKNPGWVTIKVPTSARAIADKLLAQVASGGWDRLGVKRSDQATLGAIFEEGLKALEDRLKASR